MQIWMVELGALALILLCAVHGGFQGLLLKVYSLVRIILAFAGTVLLAPYLYCLLPENLSWREFIALAASLILVSAVLGTIARLLGIVDHIPVINKLNKLGGVLLGAVYGVILLFVLATVIRLCPEVEWCEKAGICIQESKYLHTLWDGNPLWELLVKWGIEFPR